MQRLPLDIVRLSLAGLVLALAACAPGDPVADQQATLDRVFDEVWEDTVEGSAYLRLREGLPIEHLDDPSFAAYQEYVNRARRWLGELQSLDLDALDSVDHASWVDARALMWDLERAIEAERWFFHGMVLTPYSTPLPILAEVLTSRPLESAEERAAFLELLGQVPDFIAQLEARVRAQAERGIYVWRDNFPAAVGLLRAYLSGRSGGPFAIAEERMTSLGEDARRELATGSGALIAERIDPAIQSLLDFLEGDYVSQTPTEVGALRLPDGEDYYRFRVRQMTTMEVDPQSVHERGLELVAEMEDKMAALREEIGFAGSRDEFRESLRSDPKYFPSSPDEVAQRLVDAAEAMEAVIDRYFLDRPQADYGVRRLDPSLEGSQTYGIYRPPTPGDPVGRYHYNGSRLDERSWLNLRAVSLHELIPGHHFHIARQGENEALPDYRRNAWHTAYTEGWGSYSSYLGLEAGIYEGDPLSEYGMYVLEVFLACRLVVDPGMSFLGWSLEDGRDYMRQHTLESETQIQTESVRYAADMPGQALAYQMGKLELLELRQRAASELGDRFDLRAFHEAILEHGSLPMTVLEEHIEWWIDQQ